MPYNQSSNKLSLTLLSPVPLHLLFMRFPAFFIPLQHCICPGNHFRCLIPGIDHSLDTIKEALFSFSFFTLFLCRFPFRLFLFKCALGNSNPLFYKASEISEISFSPLFFTFIL